MKVLYQLSIAALVGCSQSENQNKTVEMNTGTSDEIVENSDPTDSETSTEVEHTDVSTDESTDTEQDDVETDTQTDSDDTPVLCDGEIISPEAAALMLELTTVGENEDIYSTFARIDGVASLFEDCSDPWGLFPTTYRRITARGIAAIENEDFADPAWASRIIIDFAGRYLENLQAALLDEEPSWAWEHYYYLSDQDDVSRTRAVVIAMSAHLMLDLPYSLVAIETTEENKEDFFVFGDMMIEVCDLFIHDLRLYYDTDAEDLLNGFFLGTWVDGVFGQETAITLSFQTIRTKSWNNRWYIEQVWGKWIADSEIYSSFWLVDGVLATLDQTGAI